MGSVLDGRRWTQESPNLIFRPSSVEMSSFAIRFLEPPEDAVGILRRPGDLVLDHDVEGDLRAGARKSSFPRRPWLSRTRPDGREAVAAGMDPGPDDAAVPLAADRGFPPNDLLDDVDLADLRPVNGDSGASGDVVDGPGRGQVDDHRTRRPWRGRASTARARVSSSPSGSRRFRR